MATASQLNLDDQDLSAQQCKAMLVELLESYRSADFVAQLEQLRRGNDPARYLAYIGPLCLTAQRPVLARFGLPASPEGVNLMKHAVQRRIAEGATGLETLANDARRLLGLPLLPALRGQSAEMQLGSMVFEHGALPTTRRVGVYGYSRSKSALAQRVHTHHCRTLHEVAGARIITRRRDVISRGRVRRATPARRESTPR